jgi:hypothetical protein
MDEMKLGVERLCAHQLHLQSNIGMTTLIVANQVLKNVMQFPRFHGCFGMELQKR